MATYSAILDTNISVEQTVSFFRFKKFKSLIQKLEAACSKETSELVKRMPSRPQTGVRTLSWKHIDHWTIQIILLFCVMWNVISGYKERRKHEQLRRRKQNRRENVSDWAPRCLYFHMILFGTCSTHGLQNVKIGTNIQYMDLGTGGNVTPKCFVQILPLKLLN
jgi:hypothetical protein